MAEFVGNFFAGKWDSIIDLMSLEEGEPRRFDEQFFENADGRFDENIKMLKDAGYDKVSTVEWINYYPEKHFNPHCVTEFEKFVDMKCARAWISKIRLTRFVSFISHPHPGGVFIVNDQCFHGEASGNTYKWDDYMDWHAGGNCGLHDKYIFNFLGIK